MTYTAFEDRGGLLVPVPLREERPAAPVEARVVDVEPVNVEPVGAGVPVVAAAEVLAARLDEQRATLGVRRDDVLVRRSLEVGHRIALADVRQQARAAKRARREQARDAREAAGLAVLYRRAQRSGTRARLRTQIQGSAEMRALRVARVRTASLVAGVPVLLAFAAWSTTGVQAGVVRLLGLGVGSAGWWAAWGMEPALIAIVGLIIIGRAVLRSAGGDTDRRAAVAEWAALGTSLLLNIAGGWPVGVAAGEAWGSGLAHSVGPVGAAATAFLIGLFDSYVTAARPWDGAPRLADMNLTLPDTRPDGLLEGRPDAINRGKHTPDPAPGEVLPDDVRTLLTNVRTAIDEGTLTPAPSAYAIYRQVMGGRGDKARATRVAALIASQGWNPAPRAVNGRETAALMA